MKSTNPEIYEEELKKLEKLRSEERARLKHKGGSKWKRNILVKGSRDPEVRKALIEQANIAKTLTEDCKHMSETESEIEDEDCIKIEDDNVLNEKIKILSDNKWFKESEKDLEKFKTRYFSAFPNDDKNTQFSTNEPAKECETKIKSKINIDKKFDFSKADDELLGVTNENEAFQDDDAIAEFVEENREEEESEDDMLGWGQWVTPEILSQPKPKVEKNDIQTNVILNIQNTAIKKLQPSYIPEKYKEEYLKNLKQPIGPEWNTFSKFNSNIKPRIQTLPGVPIPPLDADEKCDDETIKMKNMIKSLPLKIRETLLSKI